MWKYVSFLLPFLLIAQDLDVALPTRSSLRPIYLSAEGEAKEVLSFDLSHNSFSFVAEKRADLEADLQEGFHPAIWKQAGIPFCLAIKQNNNQLHATLFNLEKGGQKKFPPIPNERRALHALADSIEKELFGIAGIHSLKLIYTQREVNPQKQGEFTSEIWVSDADGASARQVTFGEGYCLSPQFFENSSDEFFYVSEKTGQAKIYRSRISNPKPELMIEMKGNQILASLSKQGSQMAFISDVAGRPDLFLQPLDSKGKSAGKPRQLFSQARATQATSTFHPDGKKLAFVSDKDGPPRVYLLALASSSETPHPTLITKRNRENTNPAWSPDGTKLAYSAKVDGVRQIWIYDFLMNEEIPLTDGPIHKENPAWAPNSIHLVYNTESPSSCELFLIDIKGGAPVQISHGAHHKRFASWGRQ